MKILHVVPCADEANGVYHVARMLAKKQSADGDEASVVTARDFTSSAFSLHLIDEVYVHGMWLLREWLACWKVLRAQKFDHCSPIPALHSSSIRRPRLVRMTHGSLSPIYLERQGKWKKRLVAPIERWLFSLADRVVTTGEWESAWCRQWGLRNQIETVDIKQFFDLAKPIVEPNLHPGCPLKVLYLGHDHPLKGLPFLEQAVAEVNCECMAKVPSCDSPCIELHSVSDAFDEALEEEWRWADILCLPTLSENFGLVVGEALERGKRVITTDGAPAWRDLTPKQGCYLKGYVAGSEECRIRLLKDALRHLLASFRDCYSGRGEEFYA